MFHNASLPPYEDLLGMMERGVWGTEGFMGASFPLTDLIVLSLNVDDYHIRRLEKNGCLTRIPMACRTIVLTERGRSEVTD